MTEHKNIYEQSHKKAKNVSAFTALLVTGALLVGGTLAASKIKLKKPQEPVTTTTETTAYVPENELLVLTEDFDINDAAQVKKRAQDIYDLSEKEVSVFDNQKLIYIHAEKIDKITYPENLNNDDEKFEYFQNLALSLGKILDDYLNDYRVVMQLVVNDKKDDITFTGNTGSVPCAYMFMPKMNYAKKQAIEIANLYYEQRSNILNGNVAAMTITANDYYNLYCELKKADLSTGDKTLIFRQFNSINSIFTPFLSKEQAQELEGALGFITTSTNKLYSSAAENLDLSPRLREDLEKGTFAKNITKLEEKYISEQKQEAESMFGAIIDDEPSVVDQGGKPAGDSSDKHEVIDDKVTTQVSTSDFVVSIPNEGTSEEIIPGGDVVDENTTSASTTTTKAETTTSPINDDEYIPVMNEKDFFGQATNEDIEDYRNSVGQKAGYGTGFGLMGVGSLGVAYTKKRKNKK